MSVHVWRTPDEQRYIDTRKAIRKADQEERKRVLEEQERADLWAWYANDYDVTESFAAQERARELQAAKELRQEIEVQVLITEIDQEVKQP